jgi:hypothetical protein
VIVLLVVTDGRRDCISQTIPSALAMLDGPVSRRVIYDDSGDADHREWLATQFPTFDLIHHPGGRQGFGGAIRTAWAHLAAGAERFVFHLEDDFTFNRPVSLTALTAVLDSNPHLIQLALRRQPWNDHERLAGGIVEQHPDAYKDCRDIGGHEWLEHRLFFTTNPSLYRTDLIRGREWPTGGDSEGHFSHHIIQDDPDAQFGFWGARDSGEWVTHIGRERVGTGY